MRILITGGSTDPGDVRNALSGYADDDSTTILLQGSPVDAIVREWAGASGVAVEDAGPDPDADVEMVLEGSRTRDVIALTDDDAVTASMRRIVDAHKDALGRLAFL